MYPFVRSIKELIKHRNSEPLAPDGTHVSWHRCWPQDVDMFLEMNNGRILTIFELNRWGLAQRVGLIRALRQNGWGLTVAGSSIRYRRRIKPFAKFKMTGGAVHWDERFFYVVQSIWLGDECAANALFRLGVTSKRKLVPTTEVLTAADRNPVSPPAPEWVQNWIDAEATRQWPPDAG